MGQTLCVFNGRRNEPLALLLSFQIKMAGSSAHGYYTKGQRFVMLGHEAAKALETLDRMEKAVLIRTDLRERVFYAGRNGLIKSLKTPTSHLSLKSKVESQ